MTEVSEAQGDNAAPLTHHEALRQPILHGEAVRQGHGSTTFQLLKRHVHGRRALEIYLFVCLFIYLERGREGEKKPQAKESESI